jgi:hypothetical protein
MADSITPPSELLKQWEDDWFEEREHADVLLIQAFQAGADQELEACKQYMHDQDWFMSPTLRMSQLHNARRPKPPTLKEQALTALHAVATRANDTREQHQDLDTIRQALEALPNY